MAEEGSDGVLEVPREVKCRPEMVKYLGTLLSLVEGRRVSREEILELLERQMRQHSMAYEEEIGDMMSSLKKRPP